MSSRLYLHVILFQMTCLKFLHTSPIWVQPNQSGANLASAN